MSDERIEEMSDFFNNRAETYDDHMLIDLQLNEFYDEIAKCFSSNRDNVKLLDLGCGTGLELERFLKLYPKSEVTGIDLSIQMLNELKKKYKDKEAQMNLICKSYFDVDFGIDTYDYVVSTYSLHHFSSELKISLYKRVYDALKSGGVFVEGDYTVKTVEEEQKLIEENEKIRKENRIEDGFYHYDTPFAIDTQIDLYKKSGFKNIEVKKQWDNTSIFVCTK
ncbi:MAG: class I SAM-dependent methyltransferase [Ignavibacteriales bacterium]